MGYTTIMSWIGDLAAVLALLGVGWGVWTWMRANRKVKIIATCSGEEKLIARAVPARLISRAEVNGLAAQRATGKERLDLSGFDFDYYAIDKVIKIPLNAQDFGRLK